MIDTRTPQEIAEDAAWATGSTDSTGDALIAQFEADAAAADTGCPGCGRTFKGARGLRVHQSGRYVTLACRPLR